MFDCAPPAAVFLRFALGLAPPAAAGRAFKLVLPGVFDPAGLGAFSAALRPTIEEDWETRKRRSAAASISSLFGPAVRDELEVEERLKGLIEEKVDLAPAPRADAMLVGRGEAPAFRSESLCPRSRAAFHTVPPATRRAFLSPMLWPARAGSTESGNRDCSKLGVGI